MIRRSYPQANALYEVKRLPLGEQLRDIQKLSISILIIAVMLLVLSYVLRPDAGPFIGAVCGGIGGLIGHWHATARARMRIDRERLSEIELCNIIERLHYRSADATSRRFAPTAPKWLVYRSQTLKLEALADQWVVYGPHGALRALRKRILRWLAL